MSSRSLGWNKGNLVAVYNFLRRECGEGVSLVAGGKNCRNGSEMHCGRLKLDVRNNFLMEGVMK